ncbi:MAG: Xaa-Pro peptidase family protein [Pirellulales bacterium]
MKSVADDSADPPLQATLRAGIPESNASLYHRLRFSVGDPAALVELRGDGVGEAILILRDIEMQRARQSARVDRVACPAEFSPAEGLSGDRETATAQAAAECLRRAGVKRAVADRTLPLIYAEMLRQAGIDVVCDLSLGVAERRSKDEQEIAWLREAQAVTEAAMQMACGLVASAQARADGVLMHGGEPLTSERVRGEIDVFLMKRGYRNPPSIVAGGPQGADCHDRGHGELRTGTPVIIDIFPCNLATRYNGDCTRTVVHGDVPDVVAAMHRTVCEAKQAAIAATRASVTGEAVYAATLTVIQGAGYQFGLPPEDSPAEYCAMVHGTGHGIGLDVHEPPLLDRGGPALVAGDVLTIEPGLYSRAIGGVRVEDMVLVTDRGCENFNTLPEGLDWRA